MARPVFEPSIVVGKLIDTCVVVTAGGRWHSLEEAWSVQARREIHTNKTGFDKYVLISGEGCNLNRREFREQEEYVLLGVGVT